MDRDDKVIIQWNIEGIKPKKDEVLKLVTSFRPLIIAIQETMLCEARKFSIPSHNRIRRDGLFNRRGDFTHSRVLAI